MTSITENFQTQCIVKLVAMRIESQLLSEQVKNLFSTFEEIFLSQKNFHLFSYL